MLDALLICLIEEISKAAAKEALKSLGLLLQKVVHLKEVEDDLNKIKNELEYMRSFLENEERRKGEAKTSSKDMVRDTWIKDVKNASYELEDVFDELMNLIHCRNGGGLTGLAHNISHLPADIPTAYQVEKKFEKVKADIHKSHQTCLKYRAARSTSTSRNPHQELPHFDEEENILGVEKNKEMLFEWLMHGEKQRVDIFVWGMPGLGKTTLVRAVYEDPKIKKQFKYRAWISVSRTYNREELLRSLAEELLDGKTKDKEDHPRNMGMDLLRQKISELLAQNRYLIVLDDVWNPVAWYEFSSFFPNNSFCSRILITTRNEDLGYSCKSHVLSLKPLEENDAECLFFKNIFGCAHCPQELEYYAKQIINKCKGLPLAIVTIARAMFHIPKTAFEWDAMHRRLQYELKNNEMLEPLARALMLSYNNLPSYLKRCFLYCALFPEDYVIKIKHLVRLWIAEGFIVEESGIRLEEVGENYIEKLVARSMLQVVKRKENGRAKSCRMHDLMRELALKISEGENQCVAEANEESPLDVNTRRMTVVKGIRKVPGRIPFLSLRTFLVFSKDPSINSTLREIYSEFKLLRVLDLRGVPIESVPDNVFELFNLRYLSLRETKVKAIPKKLKGLYNLQTLDLWKTNVNHLPREVLKLQKLRHLFTEDIDPHNLKYLNIGHILRGSEALSSIGDLKCLQTLRTVQADDGLFDQLGKLTQLRSLGVTGLEGSHGVGLCNCISKMDGLLRLSVKASTKNNQPLSLDNLSPPPLHLQKLILNGRLANVPVWFSSLHNLTHLYLFESHLGERESPILHVQKLENLVHLALDGAYDGRWIHFNEGSFKRLKTLCLVGMKGLVQVVINEDTMPRLAKLHVQDCKNLKVLDGIEHLDELNLWLRKTPSFDYSKVHNLPNIRLL